MAIEAMAGPQLQFSELMTSRVGVPHQGHLWTKLVAMVNWAFAILLLIQNCSIMGPWATNDGTGRVAGATITNAIGLMLTASLSAGLFLLVLPKWRIILAVLKQTPFLVLLLGLALASTTWSVNPGLTLRRSSLLLISTLSGLYLGVTFTTAQQVRLLRIVVFLVILASILVIPFPSIAYHLDGPVRGSMRGVFFHKNAFGRFLAFATAVVLIGRRGTWRNLLRTLPLSIIALLMYLARSATAVMVVGIMATLMQFLRVLLWRGRKSELAAIVLAMGAVAGFVVAVANANFFLSLVERDAGMTGRAPLWAALLTAIQKHPLLGYGLGGFFEDTFYSAQISVAAGWHVVHAHNGFLQLTIELGFVGLALFCASAWSCVARTIRHVRKAPEDPYACWPLVYLLFLLIYNVSEASLVRGNNLFWILFIAIWTSVVRGASAQSTFVVEDIIEQDEPRSFEYGNTISAKSLGANL